MTRFELLTLAASFVSCSCSAAPPTKELTVPITKPTDAIVVPKDFVGFGIESAFFIDYANDFSENLVSSLADRMSKPPVLRVGGTSGDNVLYNPAQKEARVCRAPPCQNSKGQFTLGPTFFKSYQRFQNAHTTIQAPLENPINRTNAVGFVHEAWKNLDDGKRVDAIALGNEVGYIYKEGAKSYVNAALELQQSIVKALGLSKGAAKIFEAGNTASGQITSGKGYNVLVSVQQFQTFEYQSCFVSANATLINTAQIYSMPVLTRTVCFRPRQSIGIKSVIETPGTTV